MSLFAMLRFGQIMSLSITRSRPRNIDSRCAPNVWINGECQHATTLFMRVQRRTRSGYEVIAPDRATTRFPLPVKGLG